MQNVTEEICSFMNEYECASQALPEVCLSKSEVALAAVGEVLGTLSVAVSRM